MGLLRNLKLIINPKNVFKEMEKQHPPRSGKEHLMALGAMFQYNEPKLTLSSTSEPKNIRKYILEPNWGIIDSASAKDVLSELSNLTSNQEIDIKKILREDWGISQKLVDETENYTIDKDTTLVMQFISNTTSLGLSDLVSLLFKEDKLAITYRNLLDLESINSWDIERYAGVARQSYTAGYLTEDECYEYLEKAEKMAKTHYRSWKEYALGYVLGRYYTFKTENSEQYVDSAASIIHDELSVWNQFPL